MDYLAWAVVVVGLVAFFRFCYMDMNGKTFRGRKHRPDETVTDERWDSRYL